jgi:hypothetical protein
MSRDLSILNAQLLIGYLILASIVEMAPIDITENYDPSLRYRG